MKRASDKPAHAGNRELAAVRVPRQRQLDVARDRFGEQVGIVREQDGGRARRAIGERERDVVARRPRVVDAGDVELRAAALDDDAAIAQHGEAVRRVS